MDKSNFVEEVFGKIKSNVASVLRSLADTVEKDVSMKWLLVGIAVLYFWNKNKIK